MKNFKKIFSLFFKERLLLITYILLFILTNAVQLEALSFFNEDMAASFSQLQRSLCVSIFYFAFFVFLSYEYFYRIKKTPIYETLSGTKSGILNIYLNQFVVLFILNLTITLIYTLYNTLTYFSLKLGRVEFAAHILMNMLLNFFMTAVLAILLGMALATFFRKRKISYLIMILFIFLSSSVFENIVYTINVTSDINLFPVFNFFNLYAPSLFWTPNFLFGYSVLPYRFALIFIWIFALSAILLYKLMPQKLIKSVAVSVCVILCALSTIVYFQPSSKLIMNNNPAESVYNDALYYMNNEQKNEAGGFDVLYYDLDINVTNKLNVKALLRVSENLSEYKFTLYRGYKITRIRNQDGIEMGFTQNGDYFTVNSNSYISELNIEYSGYSPKFYSNSQGMILPGFFPYYPHSGFKEVYYTDEQTFNKLLLDKKAEFDITVTSKKQVYSSLSKEETDKFKGSSTGVTIVSGFIESHSVNGIEVIYPYMNTVDLKFEAINMYMNKFVNEYHNSKDIEKIIILPSLNLGIMDTVVYDNYITARTLYELATSCIYAEINPKKLNLYRLTELYLYDDENFQKMLEIENSEQYQGDKIAVTMGKKIDKLGIEEFLLKTAEYFYDDSDTRTIIELLYDL
jgi:hypothetical protein